MKSSLRKLRGFASFHRSADLKERRNHGILARQDELLQASQEMLEMRSCYDSLLSVAAATANSAYEFSEALQEMGTCLLEKTSLNDNEVNSRALAILGKAQFELHKLVDSYRFHIIQTITTPSESFLKELQTVEEMKRQCDDKRDLYKFMLAAQREKGKTRLAKGESFSSQQLKAAQDDYEEEANLFVFRLKSLKLGQSRNLLTQAARHHAAQLNFFRKGVKSLEMVEPHIRAVAEQQHIDYNFIGLEDDDKEAEENDYSYDGNDDDELSFDCGNNEHVQDGLTMNKKSTEGVSERSHRDLLYSAGGLMTASQSAPILPEKKFELSERINQLRSPSPMKFRTYILPTPIDARNSLFAAKPDSDDQWPKHLSHSSPLEPNKPAKGTKYELSSPMKLRISQSTLKDRNTSPIKLPPPTEPLLQSNSNFGAFDSKKIKRHAFSGPLIGKAWLNNPRISANEISRSPKINELHELPRPPIVSDKPSRSSSLVGHSGPLVPRSRGLYSTSGMLSNAASPLPAPPPAISRSFSIPSTSQRTGNFTVSSFLEATHTAEVFEEISSPPLTLISFPNNRPQLKDPAQLL